MDLELLHSLTDPSNKISPNRRYSRCFENFWLPMVQGTGVDLCQIEDGLGLVFAK